MADQDRAASELADTAAGPRRVTIDGQTVETHSIPDLIAAEKFLRAKAAMRRGRTGLTFVPTKNPSSV